MAWKKASSILKENEGIGAEIEDDRVSLLRPVLKRPCCSHEAQVGTILKLLNLGVSVPPLSSK